MPDEKKSKELEDRLMYEPEEIRRMVDEYNKQKQIEYVDLHTEKTRKIISAFNVFQNIALISWCISLVISVIEAAIHYPITERTAQLGRETYPLTPLVLPILVMMGEYIGGLSKIGGTVFTTLGGALALWLTDVYISEFGKMQFSSWLTIFYIILAYLCCISMNFHPVINRYLKRFPSRSWFDPSRDKKKKEGIILQYPAKPTE